MEIPVEVTKRATAAPGRVASMDQFRGYTVAGMFLVNFLGFYKEQIHQVFKHNNTHFSYADSIMPSFLFAVGFSYRLTFLRRLPNVGWNVAARHILIRSLGLILVSLVFLGFDADFKSWNDITATSVHELLANLFKASLWEVLAIIGVAQIILLPVVAARPWVRIATILAFMAAHFGLCYAFNYDFVYGQPNWLNQYWGAANTKAWDGGFFGVIMWAVPMLGGTLAYDIVAGSANTSRSMLRMIGWGSVLMALGYGLSCLSTLYDLKTLPDKQSPVLPPLEQLQSRPFKSLLADPPFVVPPKPDQRMVNYWMMDKRIVSITFILFSTGFAFALYGLFVRVCDMGGWTAEVFRMLGQNALIAYVIHEAVLKSVHSIVPRDSPLWWCLTGLVIFFVITLAFVRYFDPVKQSWWKLMTVSRRAND